MASRISLVLSALMALLVIKAVQTLPCGKDSSKLTISDGQGTITMDQIQPNANCSWSWSSGNASLILYLRSTKLASKDYFSVIDNEFPGRSMKFNSGISGLVAIPKGNWTILVGTDSTIQDRHMEIAFFEGHKTIYLSIEETRNLSINSQYGVRFYIEIREHPERTLLIMNDDSPVTSLRRVDSPSKFGILGKINSYTLSNTSTPIRIEIDEQEFSKSEGFTIQAIAVRSDCSSFEWEPSHFPLFLSTNITNPYICAKLIGSNFEEYKKVYFDHFKGLTNQEEKLSFMTDDGNTLMVNRSVAADYVNKILIFQTLGLVVLYESPNVIESEATRLDNWIEISSVYTFGNNKKRNNSIIFIPKKQEKAKSPTYCRIVEKSPLVDNRGTLSISPNLKSNSLCIWSWSSNESSLILHIRSVQLDDADKLEIIDGTYDLEKRMIVNLRKPGGLIALNRGTWIIKLRTSFERRIRQLDIDYFVGAKQIDLSVDQVRKLEINNYFGVTFDINIFAHSGGTLLRLESDKAKVTTPARASVNGYTLSNAETPIKVTLEKNIDGGIKFFEKFLYEKEADLTIQAWRVHEKCSSYTLDPNNTTFILPTKKRRYPYNCVQMFASSTPEGYIEVDFKQFKNLTDQEDTLSFIPSDNTTLTVGRQLSPLYKNTIKSFVGNSLVILYESPTIIRPENNLIDNGLIINVRSVAQTGIIKRPKDLVKEKFVKYIFKGQPYASIILRDPLPPKVSMHVFDTSIDPYVPLITFEENEALPPLISIAKGQTMEIRFNDSSDGSALKNLPAYEYQIQNSSCSYLSYGNNDFFAMLDMKEEQSVWLIATKGQQNRSTVLSLDYFNFENDNDCIRVYKLGSKRTKMAGFCGKRLYRFPMILLLEKNFKYYVEVVRDIKTPSLQFYGAYYPVMPDYIVPPFKCPQWDPKNHRNTELRKKRDPFIWKIFGYDENGMDCE